MRILQINTADTRGGAAKVAYCLSKELKKMGHQSTMLVGQKFSSDENVFLFNDKKSFSMRLRRKMAYYFANDIDLFSSDKILKTKEFKEADIIHCHNLHSYYFNLNTLKKISRLKPIIWTFHDMWPITAHCGHTFGSEMGNGFFKCPSLETFPPIAWHNERYLESRKKKIYENSKFHIVTPSKWLLKLVDQSILKNKPTSLIYNGIDTNIFKPYPMENARHELGLPKDKKIVLSVIKGGQSNPWKGPNYISKAVKYFSNNEKVVFANIGGNDHELAQNMISIPRVNDETILAKYYSAADALLYPSTADNCPLVVLEAQACGLPVVAFETGGIPELIKDKKTGHIANYKDADDLNYYLGFLINNSQQQVEEMRKRSTERVCEMFTLNLMVDKYLQLYKWILNSIKD